MTEAGQGRRFGWQLAAIVLGAFALRMAIRLAVGADRFWIDGYGAYLELARSLAAGRGYAFDGGGPTAFRVPLYALLVWAATGGVLAKAWWLITAQALISSGTVAIAGLIARRLAGPAAGLWAAALYALWPYGAWHDVSLQESGPFAFAALLATWALLASDARPGWRGGLAAGLALGLALLTRATLLPYALLALAWLLWRSRCAGLVAVLALLLCLAPWLERQQRLTGTWGLGTETGQSLFAGNHPLTFSVYPQGSIDESRDRVFASTPAPQRAALAAMGEGERDRWYRDRGIEAIHADPGAFLIGAARKEWAAFGPWPVPRHGLKSDLAYALAWVPFLLLGLAGLILRRHAWREDLPLWAHFPTFMLTTALFWAQTAHRSYLDPVIAVYGGIALAALIPALRQRLRSRAS